MTLVQPTEREDFENIITMLGFLPVDFHISEMPETPTNTAIYAVSGAVQIRRKSTNIARSYVAGHGSAWLPQFEIELHQRLFGVA